MVFIILSNLILSIIVPLMIKQYFHFVFKFPTFKCVFSAVYEADYSKKKNYIKLLPDYYILTLKKQTGSQSKDSINSLTTTLKYMLWQN